MVIDAICRFEYKTNKSYFPRNHGLLSKLITPFFTSLTQSQPKLHQRLLLIVAKYADSVRLAGGILLQACQQRTETAIRTETAMTLRIITNSRTVKLARDHCKRVPLSQVDWRFGRIWWLLTENRLVSINPPETRTAFQL